MMTKLKKMIKGLRIKIRNQNIEGQTLNIIKYWIEKQNWKEKSNLQNNPNKKYNSGDWGPIWKKIRIWS
jgi:hypothetical protein